MLESSVTECDGAERNVAERTHLLPNGQPPQWSGGKIAAAVTTFRGRRHEPAALK